MPVWYWLVLAAILALIEIAVPAMFCILLAAAAVIVAAISWLAPALAWEYQALLFAGLAITMVGLGRMVFARPRPDGVRTRVNRRAESLIGRTASLEGALIDGRGRIKLGDTIWLVEGPDLPAGSRVRVVGADNTLLRVEAV